MEDKKILIIDDEKLIRTSLSADLKDNDYQVTTAESGEEGLEVLGEDEFDLVITDLSLEGMNGIEVLEKIKEIKPKMVVIILTGYGSIETAIDALRLGADDYLLKPCNLEELLFRISSVLEKKELSDKIEIYENILPVCCVCKKIRDDNEPDSSEGHWVDADIYLQHKAKINITHGYCPECYKKSMAELEE